MNYKLAVKLKKAGFTQKLEEGDFAYSPDGNLERVEYIEEGSQIGLLFTKSPTLEELIDACGDDFHLLERGASGCWIADYHYKEGTCSSIEGKTAKEAVANLWLKLNEK